MRSGARSLRRRRRARASETASSPRVPRTAVRPPPPPARRLSDEHRPSGDTARDTIGTTPAAMAAHAACRRARGSALRARASRVIAAIARIARPGDRRAHRALPARPSDARVAHRAIVGCERRELSRRDETRRRRFQTPAARPARPAAPSAVVSTMSGRSTGTPSMSAWNCISQSFVVAPPSTRSRSNCVPARARASRSSTSAVPYAIASSAARARCARLVPRVSPTIVPRASASQCGAPSPVSAGTKYTPSVRLDRARERFGLARRLDDAESVAQPLHRRAGDEDRRLERVRRPAASRRTRPS